MVRDAYRCADCGGYGDQVDHIDNNSHNNDPGNLATMCQPCHARKSATEQAGKVYGPIGCNADGVPKGGWPA